MNHFLGYVIKPDAQKDDPCMMQFPAGPERDACYGNQQGGDGHQPQGMPADCGGVPCSPGQPGTGPNDHHGDEDAPHCRAMGMADGSPHVDPPQDVLDQVQAEYEANCQSGNCFLGEGNYKLLEDMGHTRAKVYCFLAEGHRQHDEQHGGPGPKDHHNGPDGGPQDHLGRSPGDPGYEPPPDGKHGGSGDGKACPSGTKKDFNSDACVPL